MIAPAASEAVAPLAAQGPEWRARMIRGAQWRWHVNAELFRCEIAGERKPYVERQRETRAVLQRQCFAAPAERDDPAVK